jgi:transposase
MGQEQTIPEPVWATLRPPKHQKRSAHIVLRHRPSILTDFARLLLLLANFGKEDKPEPMCPCGCGPMTMICEDVSERLDVVPAQFRVLVTRRPKNGCRRCSGAVAQAHAPEHAWWAADRGADRLGDHREVWR